MNPYEHDIEDVLNGRERRALADDVRRRIALMRLALIVTYGVLLGCLIYLWALVAQLIRTNLK